MKSRKAPKKARADDVYPKPHAIAHKDRRSRVIYKARGTTSAHAPQKKRRS
jgi:hypothetical protein